MPSFSSLLLPFLSLFFLHFISSHSTSITLLSLNPISHQTPSQDPFQKLTLLASASRIRADHLKKHTTSQTTFHSTTPLLPHSYGAYSISLNFGTPPQKSSLIMDTGSSLVWMPCTHNYSCEDCYSLDHPSLETPPFLPKSSSSAKQVGCTNPKCSWLSNSNSTQLRCPDCNPKSPSNCSQPCPYIALYGSGLTGGVLLSETLVFPHKRIPDFAVGCSVSSIGMPAGIAGFGRGPSSLPSQLELSRFAYCLLSYRFDDTTNRSSLVLDAMPHSSAADVKHTPFLKNPTAENPAFSAFYYVGLRKVSVGGKHVRIPYRYLRPGSDGNGGVIVDSRMTFTFMESHVFEPVARELVTQVGSRYKRVPDIESFVGLRPCFNLSGDKSFTPPKLVFHFKGGADMDLPSENYFALLGNLQVACLTIVTDGGDLSPGGPSMVLGNFQLQNFYVEFDLKREKLGFRPQVC